MNHAHAFAESFRPASTDSARDERSPSSSRPVKCPSPSQAMAIKPSSVEEEALLPSDSHGEEPSESTRGISSSGLACLLLQHSSSGTYDFASFLFLIQVFKDTLVPASLVGLATKLAGLIFSGYMGGLVDRYPRLRLIRWVIAAEKGFKAINYALFLVLFGPLASTAQAAFHGTAPWPAVLATWGILLATVVCSACLGLANTTLEVAVERDWVMTIAQSNPQALTRLNTSIRRIDLFSKLLAPFFVSLLTASIGYSRTTALCLAWVLVTCAAEYLWIQVVYERFPILALGGGARDGGGEGEEAQVDAGYALVSQDDPQRAQGHPVVDYDGRQRRTRMGLGPRVKAWCASELADWAEFARLPIFATAIYLTTLSYDGTFIAYIKAGRGYDDTFIAAMRALCVLTGLLGTFIQPVLEHRLGLVRAGMWSIVSELACLAPATLAFFFGAGAYGTHGEAWNEVLLFGGIAASRVGLWAFDLCQLKELQQALDAHPRRNRLTALQISLQNTFDLAKFAMTLAAARPAQFKWTALASWLAVLAGVASYAVYLRKERGHLVHLGWLRKGC